jgi:acyl-coenzyme A synthetase/AMP-(fatty) acid ligase
VSDPDHRISITYGELDEQSDRVRDALVRSGIRRGDRVGICAPKSVPVVVAIFGILKAGAAYVPVDASAPAARNAGIFDDCDTALVVMSQSIWPAFASAHGNDTFDELDNISDGLIVARRRSMEREPAEIVAPTPDDVAYILYTSGSTGKPKGVVHTHLSALGFVNWCSETFAPSSEDRFSSHAPFHFDLSILDIYVPLKHGAALILFGDDVGKQPTRLAGLIAQSRITVWYSTPSILRLLVEYGKLDQLDFTDLRLVLFAGEVFPVKHLRALKEIWSSPDYFNLYGPTETNVCT